MHEIRKGEREEREVKKYKMKDREREEKRKKEIRNNRWKEINK
jgi:hypothetical protein